MRTAAAHFIFLVLILRIEIQRHSQKSLLVQFLQNKLRVFNALFLFPFKTSNQLVVVVFKCHAADLVIDAVSFLTFALLAV